MTAWRDLDPAPYLASINGSCSGTLVGILRIRANTGLVET